MSEGSSDKPGPRRLAETVQTVGTAGSGIRLGKTVGLSALLFIIAFIFLALGIPWFLCLGILAIAGSILVLQTISLKRIASVDLSSMNEPIPDSVPLLPNEEFVDMIPAVTEYGKVRSFSILGTGTVIRPENALLFTNEAVWALTVPISGADKVVADTDIGKYQWMFNYEEITALLMEMHATLSLEEMLRQCRAKKLTARSELSDVRTPSMTYAVSFSDGEGHRYGYSIRRKEDYERAKDLLRQS